MAAAVHASVGLQRLFRLAVLMAVAASAHSHFPLAATAPSANNGRMQNDARSAAAISLKRLAGLWLLMMRRRWRYESSVLVSAIVFGGFLVLLARTANAFDPAMLTLLLLVAVGNAVNL